MWLQLALIGLLVALLPLTLALARGGTSRYRILAGITLFLTFDLVVFGGFTRLTDSGLGCPDWPGCYGTATPFHARAEIAAAEAALPSGPVTWAKAWIEMIHRYLAMAVGVLIIALTVLAWRQRESLGQSPWYATGLLVLVCVQGAFGAWTVTMKLQPVIVTIHLLLGLTLLGGLALLAARSQAEPPAVDGRAARALRLPLLAGGLLLVLQIASGGWVSTNYAVLACTGFPSCNGEWLPQMDFTNGFTLWRELGRTASGENLTHDALVAIHWIHRMGAGLVVLYLAWLGLRVRRAPGLAGYGAVLLALLGAQAATGVTNVVLQWPLVAAVLHNAGAAALVLVMVRLAYNVFAAAQTRPVSSFRFA